MKILISIDGRGMVEKTTNDARGKVSTITNFRFAFVHHIEFLS